MELQELAETLKRPVDVPRARAVYGKPRYKYGVPEVPTQQIKDLVDDAVKKALGVK